MIYENKLAQPEGEDAEVDEIPYLVGQEFEPVAVQVEVGHLGEVAQACRQLCQEVLREDKLLQK